MSIYDPLFSSTILRRIPHYYGDVVRHLFIASAVISAVAIPLWGNLLPFGLVPEIASILLLLFLGGITHPRSIASIIADAIAAGIGVLFIEAAAVTYFKTDPFSLFLSRETVAVLLIFAFYYSVKTARAMSLHQIGKDEKEEKKEDEAAQWR